VLFRSYQNDKAVDMLGAPECTIWEAARATSAAPTFFDSIKVGRQEYVDGAVGFNNPVEVVLSEAREIWPGCEPTIQCLASLGTGVPAPKSFGDNLYEVSKTLMRMATETETTQERFLKTHGMTWLDGRYFRFNVPGGLGDIQLYEHERLGETEAVTAAYLGGTLVKESVENFVWARAPLDSK